MALTSDAALFETLEKTPLLPGEGEAVFDGIDDIIARALRIKIDVVEQDARERGLRRVLNFGHTLGHALESCTGLSSLYHGECVALGMLPMCDERVRARLIPLLARNGLPTAVQLPPREEILEALTHDKKADGGAIHTVFVPGVGEFSMQTQTPKALADRLYATLEGKE